ncbi:MAG TPA: nucleotidyltransferase domain-containing protein [Solirubrobacteraceae bacterium]
MSAIAEGATIERAARALIDAAASPARVILFGSRARGDGDDRSDFDFLVIEREVDDRFDEMVRLDRILGRMLIPADVVVISEQYAQKWGSVKGTMIHEAMTQGRIVAES